MAQVNLLVLYLYLEGTQSGKGKFRAHSSRQDHQVPPPRFIKRNTSDLDCTCNRSNLFSSCKYVLKIICPIYKTEQIHITVRSVRQREGKDTPRRSEEQPAEKCVRSELMRQQT